MTNGIRDRFFVLSLRCLSRSPRYKRMLSENAGKTKRATSKDVMSLFEQKLARVELAMRNLVDKVKDSERCIKELGEKLRGEMQGALNRVVDILAQ